MIRTANIEVSLQRLSILRIEHPQANPLKLACTLRAGETLPSGLTITAEIHTSRNVAAETAPLASSSVTVAADATSFEVLFDSPQTNQTVTPDSVRAMWLVVYGVGDSDQLYTFAAADLLLGWHAISTLTADPPATSILVEKGGVAWAVGRQYVSGTQVTVGTTAYVCTTNNTSTAADQPGVGQEWESFWVVLSGGGGGGATNLGATASPTNVVITSDTGTDATIPAADETNAGLMLPAQVTKLAGIATGATANATDAQLRDRSTHTGTQAISTIVNLQTTLDGKAATSHTHSIAGVTGLQTALDGKAATSHTHTASQINDSTSAGRAVLMAADAAAQRTALGLGSLATLSSVGTSQITDAAVTSAKIAIGAVGSTQLAATAVTAGTYANPGAITVDSDGRITSISSGNLLFEFFPRDNEAPGTSFARFDTRGDHPVLDFHETNTETAIFRRYIRPGVTFADDGTAVSIFIDAVAFSATSGVVGWTASFERLAPGGQDLDSPGFGTAQSGSTSINTDSGKIARVQINFTKAQLPSGFAAGDMFRLRIQRNTSVGSDHTADAQFVGCYAIYNPQLPV